MKNFILKEKLLSKSMCIFVTKQTRKENFTTMCFKIKFKYKEMFFYFYVCTIIKQIS